MRKVVKPNLAKSMLRNLKFQSIAKGNDKVRFAILSKDLELVRDALQDPKVDHNMYDSALSLACEYGSLDAVKLLINDYGINISANDNAGMNGACEEWHIDVIQYILSHPDFNPENCSKAFISASDNVDVVRLLLEDRRLDLSLNNNQVIKDISGMACTQSLQILLQDSRVDPSDQSNQAIIQAAKRGQMGTAKLLLEDPRVNPADQNNKALWYAAKEGNVEMFKLLLAAVNRAHLEACDRGDLSQAFNLMKCDQDD